MRRRELQRWIRSSHIIGKAILCAVSLAFFGTALYVMKQSENVNNSVDFAAPAVMQLMDGKAIYEELAQISTEAVAVDMVSTVDDEELIEASEFDGRFIANITDTLNVRAGASTESEVVGKMYPGCVGDIVATEGEWTQITSGNVSGYVKTEFILTGKDAEPLAEEYGKYIGTVTADIVNVRREADVNSEAIAMLEQENEVYVTDTLDGWYQVLVNESWEGYVSAEFLTVEYKLDTAITIEEEQEQIQAALAAEQAQQAAQSSAENGSTSVDTVVQAATEASYDDAYLLACLVSMEAGSEPYEGQLAVANVVLNRLRSGAFGSSISSVIYASGQFPSVNGSVMNGYLQNGPLPQAQQAANEALSGVNNIGGYMYFINVKYANYASYSDYTIIGNHCFH